MPETEAISAFPRNTDVVVNMVISKPQPLIGLGNLLILNKVTGTPSLAPASGGSTGAGGSTGTGGSASGSASTETRDSNGLSTDDITNGVLLRKQDPASHAVYKEFSDIDAVEPDYGKDTPVYKKAETYFAQKNPSDRVAVLDYSDSIDDALEAFWFSNWTFAVVAGNTALNSDTMHMSNIFEANKDHFLVLQTENVADYHDYLSQDYTIGLVHTHTEDMDAALVGRVASLPVGSQTWKFKDLEGINPESFTVNQLGAINKAHAIAYTREFGNDQTTEGTTLSGEYIDNEHGDIWIKTHIQSELQHLLQRTPKITYDQTGINQLEAVVNNVLQIAFEQGIILADEKTGKGDFGVGATPRSQQTQKDLSARHYKGLTFWYHRSGAIHTVEVNGTVQSDTISNA